MGMWIDAFDPFARYLVCFHDFGGNCSGYMPAFRLVCTPEGWRIAGVCAIRFRDLVTVEMASGERTHLFIKMWSS